MHQRLDFLRHEPVGQEEVLLDAERRVSALEVAGAVILHAMPERQVLRAGRRPDRVRLDEAHPMQRAFQGGRRGKVARRRKAAEIVESGQRVT
jgi:hypothetical protein